MGEFHEVTGSTKHRPGDPSNSAASGAVALAATQKKKFRQFSFVNLAPVAAWIKFSSPRIAGSNRKQCAFFFTICSIIFVEGGRKMNRNLSLCLFLEPATHSFHTIKMRARYRIRKNILSLRSISFVPSFHCTGKRKFLICTFSFPLQMRKSKHGRWWQSQLKM